MPPRFSAGGRIAVDLPPTSPTFLSLGAVVKLHPPTLPSRLVHAPSQLTS